MKRALYFLLVVCLCCALLPVGAAEPELPAMLYYNPDGGRYYHADPQCPSVKADYLPMAAFDSELADTPDYSALKPCTFCMPVTEPPADPPQMAIPEAEAAIADLHLDGEADARSFAEMFFASPYVADGLEGRTLTLSQTADGWQAVLAPADSAQPALTLWFTSAGRIQQYQNTDYALPSLDGFAIEPDGSLADAHMLDAIRNALFPYMENNEGGVFAREGDAAFYALDRFSKWIGLVQNAEPPRIIAYGDFGTGAARYPGYLTRAEAVAAGRQALAQAYGLAADEAESFLVMQAEFIMHQGVWTDADVPLPYWFMVFGDPADDYKSQYTALIDAQTGETLELHDPSTSGNG